MLGTYYYHEIIRKTIIAFGTLFNTIDIKHKKQDGSAYSTTRVPIAYGPREKFLARLEQKPDLRSRVSITLPRLAFELTSIQYDNERKVSTMQTFNASQRGGRQRAGSAAGQLADIKGSPCKGPHCKQAGRLVGWPTGLCRPWSALASRPFWPF